MDIINFFVGLLKDPRAFIAGWIITLGPVWVYTPLFLIVFVETGLVFFPFLPGDSLLFAAGVFSADGGGLNIAATLIVFYAAAILGNTSNYWIARFFGARIIDSGRVKALTKERMDKLDYFFQKYGGLTIVIYAFHAVLPHLRALHRGHGPYELLEVHALQHHRWRCLGELVRACGILLRWCTLCSRTLRGHRIGHRCRFGGSRFHRRDQDRAVFAQSKERESLGGFMAEALYRKYRPSTFEDVVGQEHIERTLKNALEQEKVSHAYLFCGPRGTGKTTMARILAKALLCEKAPDDRSGWHL